MSLMLGRIILQRHTFQVEQTRFELRGGRALSNVLGLFSDSNRSFIKSNSRKDLMTNMEQNRYISSDNMPFAFPQKRRVQKVHIADVVGELTHD